MRSGGTGWRGLRRRLGGGTPGFAKEMLDLHGAALVATEERDEGSGWDDGGGRYRPTEEGEAAHGVAVGDLDAHLRAWSRWLEKKLR